MHFVMRGTIYTVKNIKTYLTMVGVKIFTRLGANHILVPNKTYYIVLVVRYITKSICITGK